MKTAEQRERDRLDFIVHRGGIVEAIEFAKQGLEVYTKALDQAYGRVFRRELECSLKVYRQFIKENEG